jgi:hypothetical protein
VAVIVAMPGCFVFANKSLVFRIRNAVLVGLQAGPPIKLNMSLKLNFQKKNNLIRLIEDHSELVSINRPRAQRALAADVHMNFQRPINENINNVN